MDWISKLWGWGLEDNSINDRCIKNNLIIDRTVFYKKNDKNNDKNNDNITNNKEDRYDKRSVSIYLHEEADCLYDICNISYNMSTLDNIYYMVNINNFDCKLSDKETMLSKVNTKTGVLEMKNIMF